MHMAVVVRYDWCCVFRVIIISAAPLIDTVSIQYHRMDVVVSPIIVLLGLVWLHV